MPNTTRDKKIRMEVAPALKRISQWADSPGKNAPPPLKRAAIDYRANKNKKIGK